MTAFLAAVTVTPFELREVRKAGLSGREPFLKLKKGEAFESLLHSIRYYLP
ncbi:hypothetical protein U1E44_14870 [Arenibacter sp. GZD96]|nr:hypothetical protein [Arenibacter sp. GZD-96]MEA1787381.1 hypothetical protein [Arenibacter sp. GZD-96]